MAVRGEPIAHSICAQLSAAFYSDSPDLRGDLQFLNKLHHIEKSPGSWNPFTAILLDESTRILYVVFRGSNDYRDILINSFAAPAPISGDEDFLCMHAGMWIGLQSSLRNICETLILHRRSFDQILFTGHSLGGAHATLAHFGILKQYNQLQGIDSLRKADIGVVTFGAPLVFALADPDRRQDFERILKPVNDSAVHYVNDVDVVPRLLGPRAGKWEKFFEEGNCWKSTSASGLGVAGMFAGACMVATGGLALATATLAGGAYSYYLTTRVVAYGGKGYMMAAQYAAMQSDTILEQLNSAGNKTFRAVGNTILVQDGVLIPIPANSDKQRTVLSVPDGEDAYARSIKNHKVKYYVALFSNTADLDSEKE